VVHRAFRSRLGHLRRGRRDPAHARHDVHGHLRRDHRGLGVELEVRLHRRHARHRADGLLRARHGLRAGGRVDGRPEHEPHADRGAPGQRLGPRRAGSGCRCFPSSSSTTSPASPRPTATRSTWPRARARSWRASTSSTRE
jgi:hypothetical protein